MKKEYDFSKMKSKENPYSKLFAKVINTGDTQIIEFPHGYNVDSDHGKVAIWKQGDLLLMANPKKIPEMLQESKKYDYSKGIKNPYAKRLKKEN